MSHTSRLRPFLPAIGSLMLLAFVVITLYSVAQCSVPFFGGESCRLLELSTLQESTFDRELPTTCARDWQDNLRTKSAPLDFQWLALHESAVDVTLVGPNGAPVPLEKLGTLSLLNNTAYSFKAQQSGTYKLAVSSGPVSEFALHPSDCYCPTSFSHFLNRYECPAEMGKRVRKSMARWRAGTITQEMLDYGGDAQFHTNSYMLQLAIIDNKLYCKLVDGQNCPPPTEGFWFVGLDPQIKLIQAILRKTKIPDILFFWNQADNPWQRHYEFQPVFSPSSADWFADLLFPVFNLINDKFAGKDVTLAVNAPPWEQRRDIAYFVGHLSGQPQLTAYGSHYVNPRLRTAEIALERPDLLDVTVSVFNESIKENPKYYTELLDRGVVSLGRKQNQRGAVKYVIDLPGNSAAWRLGSRFGDGAVTFKNEAIWNEFWHYMLAPGKNVVMIDEWPENLVEKVEAAKEHDAEMRCMARAAQLVAFKQLRQEDLLCWTALNLQHLSTKYSFTPKLTMSEWHEIYREDRDSNDCDCTA